MYLPLLFLFFAVLHILVISLQIYIFFFDFGCLHGVFFCGNTVELQRNLLLINFSDKYDYLIIRYFF